MRKFKPIKNHIPIGEGRYYVLEKDKIYVQCGDDDNQIKLSILNKHGEYEGIIAIKRDMLDEYFEEIKNATTYEIFSKLKIKEKKTGVLYDFDDIIQITFCGNLISVEVSYQTSMGYDTKVLFCYENNPENDEFELIT